MSPAAAKRRLAKLEGSLPPRAAVLLWLEEAHAFPTLPAYIRSLLGKPLDEYPAERIIERVETAVRADMRGQPRASVEKAVRDRLRDAFFLFELAEKMNLKTAETVELEGLRLALLTCQRRCLELEAEVPEYREFPYGGRSLAERWPEWREAVSAFLSGLYEAEEVRLVLERRYLDGHPCLFPELAGEWETLVGHAEGLASVAGLVSAAPGQEAAKRGSKRARSPRLNVDALRAAARAKAPAQVAHLVDNARFDTFELLGDVTAATTIVERRLRVPDR
jgi:hypothetical protein